jgi:hypothetical protein
LVHLVEVAIDVVEEIASRRTLDGAAEVLDALLLGVV